MEDRGGVLGDGPFRDEQALGDRGIGAALGHQLEDFPFPGAQLVVHRPALGFGVASEQLRDDLRVHDGAAVGDPRDGVR